MAFNKLISFILVSLFISEFSSAEVNSSLSTEPSVTSESPLKLTASLDIPTQTFLISTSAGRVDQRQVDQRIQYNPTVGPNVGIQATWQQFSFGVSKRFYFTNSNDEKKYGKTDYDDYRLNYQFSEMFSMDSYYQSYRGFYTDLNGQEGLQTSFGGANASATATGESNIIKRSDILTRSYGVRALMALPLMPFFNAFSSEKTTNVDFNLIGKIYYNHLQIVGDQTLVPDVTANSFSPISSLKELSSNTLGVGMGLAVIVRTTPESSLGFSAMAGPGFQRQENIYTDRDEKNYTTATELNGNLFYSWANPIHGFKTGLYFDTISSKVQDVHFDSSSLGLNLAYSYSGFQF